MIAIEYNGIRVEAETAAEAKTALRKMQRQSAKADSELNAKRDLAQADARESFEFIVYGTCAVIDEESRRPSFRWHVPGSDAQYNPCNNRYAQLPYDRAELVIDRPNGRAKREIVGYRLTGLMENGGGWTVCARLQSCNVDHPEDIQYFALGAHEDVPAWILLPDRIGRMLEDAIGVAELRRAKV